MWPKRWNPIGSDRERFCCPYRLFLIAVWLVWVGGCRPALIPFDEHVPAQALSTIAAPPVPTPARFRVIFCELLDRNRQRRA
jgi:hypothetical protein